MRALFFALKEEASICARFCVRPLTHRALGVVKKRGAAANEVSKGSTTAQIVGVRS